MRDEISRTFANANKGRRTNRISYTLALPFPSESNDEDCKVLLQ